MKIPAVFLGGASILALAACGEPAPGGKAERASTELPPPAVSPQPLAVPPLEPSASPLAQAIDKAEFSPTTQPAEATRNLLIRAEVLLGRASFSPGVIDGRSGANLRNAVAAYERANDLPDDGKLDAEVWAKLTADSAPVMTDYVITEADVAGPFAEAIPERYPDMAKLERLAYTSPLEMLAERFHMDEALLVALNPDANFGVASTRIIVAAPAQAALPAVTRVEVDKAANQVRAYGADGRLAAAYPATVGSSDMPTPEGTWAVTRVTNDPHWNYDPKKLNFGDRSAGRLDIKPGPNNPVGAVWIDLSKDTYGIHGAPEPKLVGKTASHGCVRLTNWDARQLGAAVSKGTKVVFVGGEQPAKV